MKEQLKIAISGKSGCGNTTVSQLVAETLGLRFINFTFRNLAVEKGMSLPELLENARNDSHWDRELDNHQVSLARSSGGCVLGSRLAIWMLPEADLKIYLRAAAETRVRRIVNREGGDFDTVAAVTAERDRQDRERYQRIYGIDNDEYEFAWVIDVDSINPKEITRQIVEKAASL
ncbi:cytidylate kinase [Spirochaetia bacterium]|nr:cytidylate kinase [Spirochaetia bacterium]